MADINNVTLTGNLGQDPELKSTSSGKQVASVSIAVSGFSKDQTDWVRIQCWDKTAEILSKFCQKGDKVGVTGRLSVRNYEAQDGSKRTATEVVVNSLTLLGGKKDKQESRRDTSYDPDEIPF